jgi:hypothetical protein
MIAVKLPWSQVYLAACGGICLRLKSLQAGMKDTHPNAAADGWTYQIEGVAGEMAFCAAMGIFYPMRVGAVREADVLGVEVRTMRCHDWDLKVKLDAGDDAPHALVTGRIPDFQVHGWVYGKEAKRAEWLRDFQGRGQPAYYVPQSALRPLDELRPLLAAQFLAATAPAVGQ